MELLNYTIAAYNIPMRIITIASEKINAIKQDHLARHVYGGQDTGIVRIETYETPEGFKSLAIETWNRSGYQKHNLQLTEHLIATLKEITDTWEDR